MKFHIAIRRKFQLQFAANSGMINPTYEHNSKNLVKKNFFRKIFCDFFSFQLTSNSNFGLQITAIINAFTLHFWVNFADFIFVFRIAWLWFPFYRYMHKYKICTKIYYCFMRVTFSSVLFFVFAFLLRYIYRMSNQITYTCCMCIRVCVSVRGLFFWFFQ